MEVLISVPSFTSVDSSPQQEDEQEEEKPPEKNVELFLEEWKFMRQFFLIVETIITSVVADVFHSARSAAQRCVHENCELSKKGGERKEKDGKLCATSSTK